MITDHQIEYFEFKKNKEKIAEGGEIIISLTSVKANKNKLEIKYEFKIDYKDKTGNLIIRGNIIADDKNAKKTVEVWEKEKKLPDDLSKELINHTINFNRIRAAGVLKALNAKIEIVKTPKEHKSAA